MQSQQPHFDVVIVGGGLIGASQALCLAKRCPNLKIAVIEAFAASDKAQPSFDDRSIAIAHHSANYLKRLGLFQPYASYVSAIETVQVSDKGHFGKTHISAQEYQVEALGYVVEVKPFGLALHKQLAGENITLFCPNKVTAISQQQHANQLTLDDHSTFSAALIIVADGAQSAGRRLLNVEFTQQAYQQSAIIANIEVAGDHQQQAFERFTEHGPMALLPMSDHRYSLVWCAAPHEIESLIAADDTAFLSQLQQAFGYRAGRFCKVGMRAQYPLIKGQASQFISHRAVIIGNAAHAVHPIAGQGFNLGVRDIELLVEIIAQARATGQDIGDYAVLKQYQAQRKRDIGTVLCLTDSLVKLFSNSSRAFALGRSIGLSCLNHSSTLKKPLAKQLMGHTRQGFLS
ncbi:2-octaprenyl-6-methoxyphenol hydroxylase [Pseudoalteromonas ulvae UL12]|uniref:2-octaprenyl-6-methoxyphenyl hydroxylase n=1 Tax=Pseudoalteromonas ulvae TaxID=107327 RepID=UPI00186BAB4B|nr:2-octaprenyl-6-methoxyphenyl hydroxylase [Pseudoalteromonas ulvae]MBE0362793.1 2-octaprenyl-6-methoxyphenol hydroxylase [Pseudoalteromonas ulvae UL12]